jgi:hypothetical protein
MAKEKLKLTLEQEDDRAVLMTAEEAKELADHLRDAAKQADVLSSEKHEGRVSVELDGSRVVVSASRVKIEKEEDDEEES